MPGIQSATLSGRTITQVVLPVDVFVPIAGTWAVSAQAVYATVDGRQTAGLSGLGDVQLALSHVRPVGPGGVVVSTAVNVPTGQRTLTAAEAETAFLVGQGFYGFRLPSLGQGLNVTPGLTLALPLGPRLSVGAGAAYQVRGPFTPQADVAASYDPADEVLLTGGVDVGIGAVTSLSGDVAVSLYGEDTWDGETYAPSTSVSVVGQMRTEAGPARLRVLGQYRSRPPGEVTGLGLRFGADGTVPAQVRGIVEVAATLGTRVDLGAQVQGRYYEASELFGDKLVVDLRLLPRVRVDEVGSVVGRIGAFVGDVRGVDMAIGFAWEF